TLLDSFIKPEFGRNGVVFRKDILNSFCHELDEINKRLTTSTGARHACVTRGATFTLQFTAASNISNEGKVSLVMTAENACRNRYRSRADSGWTALTSSIVNLCAA